MISTLDIFNLGEKASSYWSNLRNKYGRAKRALKKESKSGSGAADLAKHQAKYDDLKYLAWLDPFMQDRTTVSNVKGEEEQPSGSSRPETPLVGIMDEKEGEEM